MPILRVLVKNIWVSLSLAASIAGHHPIYDQALLCARDATSDLYL